MRNKAGSPLDVETDLAMQTQELKTTFKGDEAVIHEVEEENNPDDPSETN